jgi:hypothetical protein
LGFNRAARLKFHLDDYTHAILYYDRDSRKIGVELIADGSAPGAVKLRNRAFGSDLSARRFIDYYDIPVPSTLRFTIEQQDAILVLDMSTAKPKPEK